MFQKKIASLLLSFHLFIPSIVMAAPPMPARIGGTVTVNGVELNQATASGYTFEVKKNNGNSYMPIAEDTDGLNASNFYMIDVPVYEAADQPEGATPGDLAVIHVYKNGSETGLTVTSPADGEITVDDSGSIKQIDLHIQYNLPPTADAGSDQSLDEGTTVTLNGSNSSDPDDGIDCYQWNQKDGPSVTLSDETAAKPTFTSPNVGPDGASLTFELTVTDQGGLQSADSCIVNVSWVNEPPAANAGPDQTVNEGATVTLNGSDSSDPDNSIASYEWSQKSGPSVTLSDAAAASPTFTAPDIDALSTAITFELTVTDQEGLQSTDSCIVNISNESTGINEPPTADAGSDQTVDEGLTVTLNGSDSSAPDDTVISYLWSQKSGTSVTLSDPSAITPTFLAPSVIADNDILIFELEVENSKGLKHTDQVEITVNDNGITGFPAEAICFHSSTDKELGLKCNNGDIVALSTIDPETIKETANRPENQIYGLVDLAVKVQKPGDTATITVYFLEALSADYKWYRFDQSDGWFDFDRNKISNGSGDGAVFNHHRNQVTLHITDNGNYDDNATDLIVRAPSGIGTAPSSTKQTDNDSDTSSDEGGGGGCFISTLTR